MTRAGGALMLLGLVAGWATAQQRPDNWQHADVFAGQPTCDACHRPHTESRSPFTLRVEGPGGDVGVWLETQAPGTRGATASCLRCHWSEQTRRRQLGGTVVQVRRGRFVGPDLRDDHALGRTDPPILRARDPRAAGRRTPVMADRDVMECTMCHDPHAPGAPPPRGAEQRRLCGACHSSESAGLRQHAVVACTGCHVMHDAQQQRHLRETTVEFMCARCHGARGTPPPAFLLAEAAGTIPLTVSPSHNPGTDCRQCHSMHR